MATDYLSIDTCPLDESCVQVDPFENYLPAMRAEASRYIEFLEKRFKNFNRISYRIESNSHDFGTYLDIQVRYNDSDEISENQAIFVDNNLPMTWNDAEVYTYPECMEE